MVKNQISSNSSAGIGSVGSLCDIRVDTFMKYLEGYDDVKKRFLYLGLTNGFKLHYRGPIVSRSVANHKSLQEKADIFKDKIKKELEKGFTAGPFSSPPFDPFITSPVGLIPKKEAGKYRLILDLSHPKGELLSVNSFIPREFCWVDYEDFDFVVSLIVDNGVGALISKTDIESAFNILPMSPEDYWLLGFSVDGLFYFKKKLPMGASISCRTFEELSKSLQFVMKKLGFKMISHILDDFIFISPASSSECFLALERFIELCKELNIPLNHDKTVKPTTCAVLHGIEVCTVSMTARLPEDKLLKASNLVHQLCFRKRVTLRELQEILGFLNFTCRVIKPGRPFLRRLFDLTRGASKPHHHIRITKGARKDLRAWRLFLLQYHGVTILTKDIWSRSVNLDIYTDAAKSSGFAAVFVDSWLHGLFEISEQQLNIAVLELYPIVLAVVIWSASLSNRCVVFHCDNNAVVHMINKQSSDNTSCMSLLRYFVIHCMQNNILVKAQHIPGKENVVSDMLSRQQVDQARFHQPSLEKLPRKIPKTLNLSKLLANY